MQVNNVDEIKNIARRIEQLYACSGGKLSHSAALDFTAELAGFKDYRTAKAVLESRANSESYHVIWEIELNAENAADAADKAFAAMQDPLTLATVFSVTYQGKTEVVDVNPALDESTEVEMPAYPQSEWLAKINRGNPYIPAFYDEWVAEQVEANEDIVAEWVGLHYGINYSKEPRAKQLDWHNRYAELHDVQSVSSEPAANEVVVKEAPVEVTPEVTDTSAATVDTSHGTCAHCKQEFPLDDMHELDGHDLTCDSCLPSVVSVGEVKLIRDDGDYWEQVMRAMGLDSSFQYSWGQMIQHANNFEASEAEIERAIVAQQHLGLDARRRSVAEVAFETYDFTQIKGYEDCAVEASNGWESNIGAEPVWEKKVFLDTGKPATDAVVFRVAFKTRTDTIESITIN